MNCGVCILLLHALRRRGGGGESEDEGTKMMSSGSGFHFLLRRGMKKGIFDAWRGGTRDEECLRCPRVGAGSVMWLIDVHARRV